MACNFEQAPGKHKNSTFGMSCMPSFAEGPKPAPLKNFKAGQSVEMHSGSFAKLISTLEEMASDAHVWILLNFMGKETSIQVNRQYV